MIAWEGSVDSDRVLAVPWVGGANIKWVASNSEGQFIYRSKFPRKGLRKFVWSLKEGKGDAQTPQFYLLFDGMYIHVYMCVTSLCARDTCWSISACVGPGRFGPSVHETMSTFRVVLQFLPLLDWCTRGTASFDCLLLGRRNHQFWIDILVISWLPIQHQNT